MQPTSSSSHVSALRTVTGHDQGNVYAAALHSTITQLIPPTERQARLTRPLARSAASERSANTGKFSGASNSAADTNGTDVNHNHATHGLSVTHPTRRSRSPPADIDFLCAIASRKLIDQTVADIRAPGVWNEHLLDVLLGLKRKRPELLGAAQIRVAASNLIPACARFPWQRLHASESQNPSAAGASVHATPTASVPLPPVPTDDVSQHLSFYYEGQHYHIVNTKEAFFRAIISVREQVPPAAVTKQKIDALIKDTADFLEEHWQEYYRVVWTRMAKSGAT